MIELWIPNTVNCDATTYTAYAWLKTPRSLALRKPAIIRLMAIPLTARITRLAAVQDRLLARVFNRADGEMLTGRSDPAPGDGSRHDG